MFVVVAVTFLLQDMIRDTFSLERGVFWLTVQKFQSIFSSLGQKNGMVEGPRLRKIAHILVAREQRGKGGWGGRETLPGHTPATASLLIRPHFLTSQVAAVAPARASCLAEALPQHVGASGVIKLNCNSGAGARTQGLFYAR